MLQKIESMNRYVCQVYVNSWGINRLSLHCIAETKWKQKCPGLSKMFLCFCYAQFFIYLLDNIIITDQMALTVHKYGADHYDLAADKLKSLGIPSHQQILLEGFSMRMFEAAPSFLP